MIDLTALDEDYAHVSFTQSGWEADPWRLLDAARRWHPIRSRTIPRFDVDSFQAAHGLGDWSPQGGRTPEGVLTILNDPVFRKGPEANVRHPSGGALRLIERSMSAERPIEIVVPSFAGRPHNPAAHRRVSPDLGELYALQKLKNISDAIKTVYPPGVVFSLLLDGRAYRPFYGYSDDEGMPYGANLQRQIELLGARADIRTIEMHDLMTSRARELESIDQQTRHEVRVAWDSGAMRERPALVRALRQGTETTAISAALIELYKTGTYTEVDLHRLFAEAERVLAHRAEHTAFEYAVLMTKLRKINLIGDAFRGAIRGTVHPKPGQYSARLADPRTRISPWHGVAIQHQDGSIVTQYEAMVYQDFDTFTAVFVHGDEAPFYYERGA